MKRKLLIAIFLIFTTHLLFNYHRIQIDSWKAELFSILFGEDTKYSSDFSNRNFRKIKIGMTEQQVIDLLGQPLSKFAYKWVDNKTYNDKRFIGFKFSESPNSSNYRLRIIQIDKGIVVGIMGEFYQD